MQTVSRLIHQFVPDSYQLSLTLDRIGRSFGGTVTIHGSSPVDTGTIIVHAKDLSIESATVDGKEAEFSSGNSDELTVLHPDIHTGKHVLVIAFSGTITDAMHGLYPCYYEHDGIKKELLATQFESHHAREVFPCIDEPEAKAIFDVTLTTEQGIVVLGNMPVISTKVESDLLVTRFDTTPRMSTYLLAWVAGNMHKKSATTNSGVEVNVWSTPAQPLESLDFALDHAVRTIEFFDDYFDMPYPLPKSDHVALPDFSSGAMENWGLITYREIALLVDPANSSVSSKQYVALVVAHELSHQWFGNLVTMKWWNNLWLNESFATLMEYIAVDALHPEWNTWLDFSTQETIMALRRDSIDGVQPVQTDVAHPDEISTLFDGSIVYAKGARLLRMLRQYIGEEAFQQGLRAYFNENAYKNTEGDDLWSALSKASGKDISSFMNTWISQPGYPVVHVSRSNHEITLGQQQFFIGPHNDADRLWPIPLNAAELPDMLSTRQEVIKLKNDTPIRLNVGDSAHFLTKYDDALFMELVATVSSTPPLDRLQLLHEQTLLARGGVVSTASLVPLLDAYKYETNEAVWDIISLSINELKKFVETDEKSEEKLRMLARNLAQAEYERLGWHTKPGEEESDTKLRGCIIGLMLYGEDKDAIVQAIELYQATPLEALDAELRPLIIGTAVKHGDDPSIIKTLIGAYKKAGSAELRDDIAMGMTSTRKEDEINELLSVIQDNTIVRTQDVTHMFVWLIRNRYGRETSWQWLMHNWDWIKKTFGSDKSYDDFPRYAATGLMTRRQLNEFKDFFLPLQHEPALTRVITMGISEIEARVDLIERDSAAVREALAQL